ncbi:MAG: hypothetical protein R2731_15765 [Nocardioides sp.]
MFDGPAGHAQTGHPALWDLTTGQRVTLTDIGANASDVEGSSPYWTQQQAPGFWSPDEQRVLLFATTWERRSDVNAVVAGWDGTVSPLRTPQESTRWPMGWVDDGHVAWLRILGVWPDSVTGVRIVVTDLTGRQVRQVPVALGDLSLPTDFGNQWAGSVAPGGRQALLRLGQGGDGASAFDAVVDLDTGRVVRSVAVPAGTPDGCAVSWSGQEPAYPGSAGVTTADAAVGGRVDPPRGSWCSTWAAAALAGPAHRGAVGWLAGLQGWAPLWWWRETVWGLLALVGLGWLWRARRRRRRP